jgi:hypothetical protein
MFLLNMALMLSECTVNQVINASINQSISLLADRKREKYREMAIELYYIITGIRTI